MWPFKKPLAMSTEEWAATKPPAPCGYQTDHYFWTKIKGFNCPKCARIKEKKQKDADENRMAEKIAAAVVRQLSARGDSK